MIQANRLFARRLKSEWKFQYKVWKMAVDWTVALYFVIPGLLVAGYNYTLWWRDMPAWGHYVPELALLILLYFASCSGSLRLFLEEADQLFLIRNQIWMNRLKGWGIAYSLTAAAPLSAAATCLAAPFLVKVHQYGSARLLLLGAVAALNGMLMQLAGRWIALRLPRLTGWFAQAGCFLALGAMFLYAARLEMGWGWSAVWAVVLAAGTVLLVRVRMRMTGTFYQDAAYEYDQRMKFAALLMGYVVPKPAKLLKRKKPWLLAGSRHLFRKRTPDRVLAETIVKSFFRSGTQLKLYIQFTLACSFALLALPVIVKWVFWLGVSFLLAYWIKMYGKEVMASSFLKLFRWQDADRLKAISRATPLLFVPAYVPAGLLLGWSAYGWWAGLLLIPAGWLIGYVMGEMLNGW
ncbi:ABC transporter permease [Paenibacillus sp. GYB004]|uniref:ABC transporter permease n=1 Tax=Paenibacillus sp. GYB004 TaxID=2994393 RepID=UPI002F963B21